MWDDDYLLPDMGCPFLGQPMGPIGCCILFSITTSLHFQGACVYHALFTPTPVSLGVISRRLLPMPTCVLLSFVHQQHHAAAAIPFA
jgi:hypothetical protein